MVDDRRMGMAFKEMIKSAKTTQAVQEQVQRTVSTIGSHVREVLGPLAEVFDFIKDTLKNVFNFFKGIVIDVFGGVKKVFGKMFGEDYQKTTAEETEKQTGLLRSILNVFRDEQKEKLLEESKKGKRGKKGLQGWLLWLFGGIAAILGGILGGLAKRFMMPFEIFLGAIRRLPFIGKIITNIIERFKKLKILKKITSFKPIRWVIDLMKGFFSKFKWLGKIFKVGGKTLGKFATAFAKGFKILGWPLTLLLGVIDFIKGFMGTEGTLMQKIEGGVKSAIKGFIELPAKVVGWIVEKIGNFMGFKIEEGSIYKKIMGLVDEVVDIIFHPWDYLVKGVNKFTDWFINMWNSLMDGIISLAKHIPKWLGREAIVATAEALKFEKTGKENKIEKAENERLKEIAKEKRMTKEALDLGKSIAEHTKKGFQATEKGYKNFNNFVQNMSAIKEEAPKDVPSTAAREAVDILVEITGP